MSFLSIPLFSKIKVYPNRFYRGENAGPDNAGIGLSLARAIVARQNGVLFAQNPPEGGAKFTFRFYRGDF